MKEVFSAKTGDGSSTELQRNRRIDGLAQPIMAKLTLSYGGTPTVTVALEGSKDGGVNWTTIVSAVYTTGTPKYLHANRATQPRVRYRRWRLTLSANTNVTIDKAYLGVGEVED